LDLQNTPRGSNLAQGIEEQLSALFFFSYYTLSHSLLKHLFVKDHPLKPKTFGPRIGKAGIDAGLRITLLFILPSYSLLKNLPGLYYIMNTFLSMRL
jgi:hypothetical protein